MAKQFSGLSDSDIFSAECKHRFSLPRKAGGTYTVTAAGRPDGDSVKALAKFVDDATVNVSTKLPDIGGITRRTTTERDISSTGKLVEAVRYYGGTSATPSADASPVKGKGKGKVPAAVAERNGVNV